MHDGTPSWGGTEVRGVVGLQTGLDEKGSVEEVPLESDTSQPSGDPVSGVVHRYCQSPGCHDDEEAPPPGPRLVETSGHGRDRNTGDSFRQSEAYGNHC